MTTDNVMFIKHYYLKGGHMFYFIFVLGIALGVMLNTLFRGIKRDNDVVGTLQIIDDEDGTYLSLALNQEVSTFRNEKQVTMDIRILNTHYYE